MPITHQINSELKLNKDYINTEKIPNVYDIKKYHINIK